MARRTDRRTGVGTILAGIALASSALLPAFCPPPASGAQAKTGDVTIGTRYVFTSGSLKGEVPVRVHLPATSPKKGEGPPPVLYLLEIADDFVYASATADFLARCGRVPGLVVVAVDVDRLSGPPQGMIDFLDKDLIPFVERTAGAGPRRVLFGHSGRSFAALFILLERPDLFDGYICAGLGLTWPLEKGRLDFSALAEKRWAGLAALPKSLVFSLGDEEKFFPGVERFVSVLKAKAPSGLRWTYLRLPGEDHESTKLKTLYQGLEFVFGTGTKPEERTGE
jgi:hypothetical protein